MLQNCHRMCIAFFSLYCICSHIRISHLHFIKNLSYILDKHTKRTINKSGFVKHIHKTNNQLNFYILCLSSLILITSFHQPNMYRCHLVYAYITIVLLTMRTIFYYCVVSILSISSNKLFFFWFFLNWWQLSFLFF